MERTSILCIIHGRVQGVGYRAWAEKNARKLELHGWVRNLSDGTVEALFSGPAPNVRMMLERCRKGPLAAKVNHIDTRPWDSAAPLPEAFMQLPTA